MGYTLTIERPVTVELRRGFEVVESREVSNAGAYGVQVDAFAAAIETAATSRSPAKTDWKNQLILDAAYRSVKSGKWNGTQCDNRHTESQRIRKQRTTRSQGKIPSTLFSSSLRLAEGAPVHRRRRRSMVRQRLRHFGHVPRPGREQRRSLVDLLGDHLVEGLGLAVVSLAVMRRKLNAEVCGHALLRNGTWSEAPK